jgi:hypothetical protein
MQLHQLLAVLKGAGIDAFDTLSKTDHVLAKVQLLGGRSKVYSPANDEDTTRFPNEYQKVQVHAGQVIKDALTSQIRAMDLTAMRDYSNTVAKADVVVDGQVFVKDAPIPFLLWLEERLKNLETFIGRLPTLPSDTTWTFSDAEGAWESSVTETTKTKKVPEVVVLYPATPEHPAQVKVLETDVVQGYWASRQFSGALRRTDVSAMQRKIRKFQDAVKMAIMEANSTEAVKVEPGKKIYEYLFSEVL